MSISPFVTALDHFANRYFENAIANVALLSFRIQAQEIHDFTFYNSEMKQAKIKQILAFRITRVFSFRDYCRIDPILVYLISIKASKIEWHRFFVVESK